MKILDKEKIAECIAGLRTLIEDWVKVETSEIEEQAERLIIAKAAELVKLAEPKKSEMACNCCGECAEEIDAQQKMLAVVEAVDAFTTAINKLANK